MCGAHKPPRDCSHSTTVHADVSLGHGSDQMQSASGKNVGSPDRCFMGMQASCPPERPRLSGSGGLIRIGSICRIVRVGIGVWIIGIWRDHDAGATDEEAAARKETAARKEASARKETTAGKEARTSEATPGEAGVPETAPRTAAKSAACEAICRGSEQRHNCKYDSERPGHHKVPHTQTRFTHETFDRAATGRPASAHTLPAARRHPRDRRDLVRREIFFAGAEYHVTFLRSRSDA
jgi:hypothetical protein